MEDENQNGISGSGNEHVVDVYPLSGYYFGSKEAAPAKDETPAEKVQRMEASYAAHGMRTRVEGVLLVELFNHPHMLLLQVRNSFFKLPGGSLRHGESDTKKKCNMDFVVDTEGLKRKLSSKLSFEGSGINDEWDVGECIGMWWRSEFETLPYPYMAPNVRRPKECTKVFLVRLPISRRFLVPKNVKLLAVPLREIQDNCEAYGPIISGIPHLFSKFSFNVIQD